MAKRIKTKLELILEERGLSQGDLIRLIENKTAVYDDKGLRVTNGFVIGRDRISKICSGRLTNYHLETAQMIAEALGISIDSFVELNNIKKQNLV